ncbi:M20 family metallopeptidase [Methanospirillum sp.]|uniref:M20 family metallopeptidase n=1 Tax=Methanospirillum sp. TaxID=45200 RepID=UPI002986AF89|nr:M20/M25/M40 family metallo-hydrolase [Methanospirillum sp.]
MMDPARLCSELVKIPSENPPGYTDDVISYLQDICSQIGIETKVLQKGRKHNLLSKNMQNQTLLCGHVDVVPALPDGWTHPPFSGKIDDSRVHGRGATDMKGGCAALLCALEKVLNEGFEPPVDIAFVCDEEGNGDFGMEYLLSKGCLRPNACLIAEPTPELLPVIGEKGIVRLQITFTGDAGHSSLYPVVGSSAIMQTCAFLDYCEKIHQMTWPQDPLVYDVIQNTTSSLSSLLSISKEKATTMISQISYNPGHISGGERINVIAQRCELHLDLRIPWGCDISRLIEMIKSHNTRGIVKVLDSVAPTLSPPGRICNLVCAGIESVHGKKAMPGVTQAASDARHLRATGAEVVNYGPGDLSLLHAVDESVPIHMLNQCMDVYVHVLSHLNKS